MRSIIKIFLIFVLGVLPTFSCSSDNSLYSAQTTRMVQNFYITSTQYLYVSVGEKIPVSGNGFEQGDILSFSGLINDVECELPIEDINGKVAQIKVIDELTSGAYSITLKRGDKTQYLAQIRLYRETFFDIPDKGNANIKGVIFCDGAGVPNVRVTDGKTTTTTDENGMYWIESDKSKMCVYYTIPRGYMPETMSSDNMGYWQPLSSDVTAIEQHNFEMVTSDVTDHIMLMGADLHLANKQNDLARFKEGYLTDTKEFAESASLPVYSMLLGDLTWDKYWYDNNFIFSDYINIFLMFDYAVPTFQVIGNHDNDPYVIGDEAGQMMFRKYLGPNYYSFNIGDCHYVVLDNINWTNTGGEEGKVGARDFSRYVSAEQMAWLAEDLAAVEDKDAPLIIALHAPLYYSYNSTFENYTQMSNATGGSAALVAATAGFNDVHFCSGHTHVNSTMIINDKAMEHNIASVCETWWWSTYLSNRSICLDGSPTGYKVFNMKKGDVSWHFKSIGEKRDLQMRSYDMNTVKSTLISSANQAILSQYENRKSGFDYAHIENNEVLINIWGYDAEWSVKVTENGTELPCKRVLDRDPLHTIAFDIPRVAKGYPATTDWISCLNSHMFSVVATSASSTLDIEVTDRFGNVYTETMTRPKSYDITMK